MAKVELHVFDANTGKVARVVTRSFIPVSLFLRYQEFSEMLEKEDGNALSKIGAEDLRDLVLETFPDLTEDEYSNNVDTAEVIALFVRVAEKVQKFEVPEEEKN